MLVLRTEPGGTGVGLLGRWTLDSRGLESWGGHSCGVQGLSALQLGLMHLKP